jgi:hypothetical protein
MKNKEYTLITGASSRIGKALAFRCAERKMNLVLVALPCTGLRETAGEISEAYGTDVKIYEADLTENSIAEKIHTWCEEEKIQIKYLINNAGMGYADTFENMKMNFFNKMMKLNMNAVVAMTHAFIPDLKKISGAGILNVSSMASMLPIPNKSVYAASKSFVLSFSRAMNQELKSHNIHVSCLCPGAVPTSEQVKERMKNGGWLHKLFSSKAMTVAEKAVRQFLKEKTLIIPNYADNIVFQISKLIPANIRIALMGRIMGFNKNK